MDARREACGAAGLRIPAVSADSKPSRDLATISESRTDRVGGKFVRLDPCGDALDASELTRLDLAGLRRRYGFPYMVIHRSDLHGIFLRACAQEDVELLTSQLVTSYENTGIGARVVLADGGSQGLVEALHFLVHEVGVDEARRDAEPFGVQHQGRTDGNAGSNGNAAFDFHSSIADCRLQNSDCRTTHSAICNHKSATGFILSAAKRTPIQ